MIGMKQLIAIHRGCSPPTLFFVYTGANFSSRLPPLLQKWKLHPNLLTPYSTISATGTPVVMSAKDVYRPSESELKCPETLVNKQKTARPALRDQEAAGSNPVTPMLRKPLRSLRFQGFLFFRVPRLCVRKPNKNPTRPENRRLFSLSCASDVQGVPDNLRRT